MATGKLGEGACPLVPVLGQAGCAGHLLRTAKGFRAFNREGSEIATFDNFSVGAAALLDLAITTDKEPHD